MSKEKPICLFCRQPVSQEAVYYIMEGPDGNEIAVHNHAGVEEHDGVRMLKGKPFPRENN